MGKHEGEISAYRARAVAAAEIAMELVAKIQQTHVDDTAMRYELRAAAEHARARAHHHRAHAARMDQIDKLEG